jgi:hypothetical protein
MLVGLPCVAAFWRASGAHGRALRAIRSFWVEKAALRPCKASLMVSASASQLTLGVRAPRQAGDLVNSMGVSCSRSGGCELIDEQKVSPSGSRSRRKGAHDFDKAPPQPKMALASDRDFGDMRVAQTLIIPGLPGHRAALLGRSSCFWARIAPSRAELRVRRGTLIWPSLARRIERSYALTHGVDGSALRGMHIEGQGGLWTDVVGYRQHGGRPRDDLWRRSDVYRHQSRLRADRHDADLEGQAMTGPHHE